MLKLLRSKRREGENVSETETRPAIDLAKYHSRHPHGDLTVYATWIHQGDEGYRPCLVIVPTDERRFRSITPYVIPQANAWIWADGTGDRDLQTIGAMHAANDLDLNPGSRNDVHRIMGLIHGHLDTLLTIPPRPDFEPRKVAEIVMRREDGATEDVGVVDDV